MYYQLECDENTMTAFIEPDGPPADAPVRGQIETVAPAQLPFKFVYQDEMGEPLFDYYSGDCLMSKKLIDVLAGAGADNIQAFDAVLTDSSTGKARDDYVVANVIGLVSCADVDASTTSELGATYYFHDLVIDPTRVGDLLLFRLAESLMDVLVHERVAKAIEAAGLNGIVLTPLKESS